MKDLNWNDIAKTIAHSNVHHLVMKSAKKTRSASVDRSECCTSKWWEFRASKSLKIKGKLGIETRVALWEITLRSISTFISHSRQDSTFFKAYTPNGAMMNRIPFWKNFMIQCV